MKANVLRRKDDIRIEEVAKRKADAGEAVIRDTKGKNRPRSAALTFILSGSEYPVAPGLLSAIKTEVLPNETGTWAPVSVASWISNISDVGESSLSPLRMVHVGENYSKRITDCEIFHLR